MLVLLEGNIAAGKTTLGHALRDYGGFAFIPEPIERWQTGFAANLLKRFYDDMGRWSFTLQICAFLTRAQALADYPNHEQVTIFERSIYCDRHVFAKNLHDQGFMDDTEWALYLLFWDRMKESVPEPDAILYLRTPARECHRRLLARGRDEESIIPLAYLEQLEARHDAWLRSPEIAQKPVIELDGLRPWTGDKIITRLAQIAPQ